MKKLIVVAGLAICLCGCGNTETTSEKAKAVTEASANIVEKKPVNAVAAPKTAVATDTKKVTTQATTKSTTEVTTEKKTKATEKKTEQATEKATEKKSAKVETKTEKKTEAKTEKVTEKKTEKQTEKVTETKTEKATEKATEVAAEISAFSEVGSDVYNESKRTDIGKGPEEYSEPEETTEQVTAKQEFGYTLQYSAVYNVTSGHLTRSNGSIRYNGHRETWYSTNESAGKNTARSIPGKHVADDGTIRDADGYICVASSDYKFYTVLMTSVGPAKVYDCGCSHGTVDVYTCW